MDSDLSKRIEPKISVQGLILEPNFHDGNLLGMILKEPNSLALYLTEIGGEKYKIEIVGLIRLKTNNFLEGNTIFGMSIYSGSNTNSQLIANVYGVTLEEAKATSYFQESFQRLQRNELKLLEITPSYGCELLALCRDYKIFQDT